MPHKRVEGPRGAREDRQLEVDMDKAPEDSDERAEDGHRQRDDRHADEHGGAPHEAKAKDEESKYGRERKLDRVDDDLCEVVAAGCEVDSELLDGREEDGARLDKDEHEPCALWELAAAELEAGHADEDDNPYAHGRLEGLWDHLCEEGFEEAREGEVGEGGREGDEYGRSKEGRVRERLRADVEQV